MGTNGIDVNAIQETWLPDNFITASNDTLYSTMAPRCQTQQEERKIKPPLSNQEEDTAQEVVWHYFYHPRPAQQHGRRKDIMNREWRADQYLGAPDSSPPLHILLTTLEI
eukprot:scaffold178671_cov68-Attheya_sp.AAC.1